VVGDFGDLQPSVFLQKTFCCWLYDFMVQDFTAGAMT
jgi:hypothetical protein